VFKSKAGVTNHQMTFSNLVLSIKEYADLIFYNAEYKVTERVKPRWVQEEDDMVLLAEADLPYNGIKPRLINGELEQLFQFTVDESGFEKEVIFQRQGR